MEKKVKPVGYIEHVGHCIIKKVSNYGKKYTVYKGVLFWRFADIHKARQFAITQ